MIIFSIFNKTLFIVQTVFCFYYGQGKIKGIISITLAFIYLFLHVSTWLKTNLDFVPTLLLLGTWHSLVTNLNEPISFSYR